MIKEIPFGGISTTPSDYLCADGELTYSSNLISEDNSLRTPPLPSALHRIPSTYRLLYIHKQPSYTNYILWHLPTSTLHYADATASTLTFHSIPIDSTLTEPTSVTSLGNTLIILASSPLYLLRKPDSVSEYLYLGSHLPEIPCYFALDIDSIAAVTYGTIDLGKDYTIPAMSSVKLDETATTTNTSHLSSDTNIFINEQSVKAGKYIFPFFVRYAFRLYDGSLTMQSVPMLMLTSIYDPIKISNMSYTSSEYESVNVRSYYPTIYAALYDLRFRTHLTSAMLLWKDIIKSIDIFITPPIYTYNPDGSFDTIQFDNLPFLDHSIASNGDSSIITQNLSDLYYEKLENRAYVFTPLPSLEKDFTTILEESSNFFLLHSYSLDNLQSLFPAEDSPFQTIELKENFLSILTTQEQLPDDYLSHDQIIPAYIDTYNQRVNFANIHRTFHSPHPLQQHSYTTPSISSSNYIVRLRVVLNNDFHQSLLVSETSTYYSNNLLSLLLPFFYYPNADASHLIIDIDYNGTDPELPPSESFLLPLRQHTHLNGSFCIPYKETWQPLPASYNSLPLATSLHLPNRIYTSEIQNPFVLPTSNMNAVGSGTIIALAQAVAALSTGQFGQFPLYAFTTEGIWALSVSTSTGAYTTIQPVSRDIISNPRSLCSIDSAIIFATSRGLMQLQGSQTTLLSSRLQRPLTLPGTLLTSSSSSPVSADTSADLTSVSSFISYIQSAYISNDYANQRLLIYQPCTSSPLLYSLDIRTYRFTLLPNTYLYPLNSYPDTLIVSSSSASSASSASSSSSTSPVPADTSAGTTSSAHSLLSVSTDTSLPSTTQHSVLLTRPFKLDDANSFKVIDHIRVNGYLDASHLSQILYGSNDLLHWHIITTSQTSRTSGRTGTSFRFFRLALCADLLPSETLDSFTISYRLQDSNPHLL